MAAADRDWALLPDDITRDIFARLRPSEPLYLFQVSHLCKDWLRALTDPDFPRRLHERCVTPLPLGFLHGLDDESVPTFVRTINWPFSPADVPERRHWKVLDYRHGRALFLSTKVRGHGGFDLLVWDPISGDRHHVPVPPEASRGFYPGAALVCAVPGCNHRPGCNGGHFQVAFVANQPLFFGDDDPDDEEMEEAFIYSSETELWIKLNPIPDWSESFGERTSVLVGHSVYIMSDGLVIFELDLVGLKFSEIPSPDIDDDSSSPRSLDGRRTILMVTEDGRLGMAEEHKGSLYLWSREATGSNIATWVQTRSLDPYDLCLNDRFDLIGFAEGANVIFMRLPYGIYTLELSSDQTRKVLSEVGWFDCVFPVVSFYATHNVLQGPGGVHHNLPNTSVDDGGKGIEGEGKALELALQLFNDGSNSIEQMDFLAAVQCLSQSLDIRVGHYGKLATECATTYYKYGCALLYKARQSTDCIANVHKETATEESVKNKEYDENSKASGTNAEDAPSLEKVDSDEGYKSNHTNQEYGIRAGDQDVSDLELAWEMLDIARKIVEKSPNNTTDMVHILSILDEVNIERGKKESNSEHNVSSPSTDPEAAERGTKRANYEPVSRGPSPKRHAEDP